MRMRSSILSLGLALGAIAAAPALAAGAPASTTPNSSQQKMADCSHQSKGMQGEAHKQFMSDCLHGKTATTHATTSQQQKMKTCNAEANGKSLKGDERKSFMSTCLKG